MQEYHTTAFGQAAPSVEFKEWTKKTPIRAPTVGSDVAVPFFQAAISGVIVGVGGLIILLGVGLPWWWSLLIGMSVLALIWFWRSTFGWRLLYAIETIIGHDITGDDVIGRPTVELQVTKTDERGHKSMFFPVMPTSDEKLLLFAKGALSGIPLSQGEWCGESNPFSRKEFEGIMKELQKLEFARWRNPDHPSQGRELTPMGRAALKDLLLRNKAE